MISDLRYVRPWPGLPALYYTTYLPTLQIKLKRNPRSTPVPNQTTVVPYLTISTCFLSAFRTNRAKRECRMNLWLSWMLTRLWLFDSGGWRGWGSSSELGYCPDLRRKALLNPHAGLLCSSQASGDVFIGHLKPDTAWNITFYTSLSFSQIN